MLHPKLPTMAGSVGSHFPGYRRPLVGVLKHVPIGCPGKNTACPQLLSSMHSIAQYEALTHSTPTVKLAIDAEDFMKSSPFVLALNTSPTKLNR